MEHLEDILSEDFWISPNDARRALASVNRSALSLDRDMQNNAELLPTGDVVEWDRWYRQLLEYTRDKDESWFGAGYFDGTGVLAEAEKLTTDLGAWRDRYQHFTGNKPATPAPVRVHAGPTTDYLDSTARVLIGVAMVGAVGLMYKAYKRWA